MASRSAPTCIDGDTGNPYYRWMSRAFEWDSRKAAANVEAHDVEFDYAARVFADPDHAEVDTTRAIDRERRTKAIGVIDGQLFTVVFTMRNGTTRLISARRANAKETRAYDNRPLHP